MTQCEKFTFFWYGPLSQWHLCSFKDDAGIQYNCAEQYMMYRKANLMGDPEAAKKILASPNPKEQKLLGRKVHNFDIDLWDKNSERIVYKGNYFKFTQNPALKEFLLKTKGATLVEASPYDCIWGIGLSESDPKAKDRKLWRGENRLGVILTKLREDLLLEEKPLF